MQAGGNPVDGRGGANQATAMQAGLRWGLLVAAAFACLLGMAAKSLGQSVPPTSQPYGLEASSNPALRIGVDASIGVVGVAETPVPYPTSNGNGFSASTCQPTGIRWYLGAADYPKNYEGVSGAVGSSTTCTLADRWMSVWGISWASGAGSRTVLCVPLPQGSGDAYDPAKCGKPTTNGADVPTTGAVHPPSPGPGDVTLHTEFDAGTSTSSHEVHFSHDYHPSSDPQVYEDVMGVKATRPGGLGDVWLSLATPVNVVAGGPTNPAMVNLILNGTDPTPLLPLMQTGVRHGPGSDGDGRAMPTQVVPANSQCMKIGGTFSGSTNWAGPPRGGYFANLTNCRNGYYDFYYQLRLGDVADGANRTFRLYYGAAPDQATLERSMRNAGAEVWSVWGEPKAGGGTPGGSDGSTPFYGWGIGHVRTPTVDFDWTPTFPSWWSLIDHYAPGQVCQGLPVSFHPHAQAGDAALNQTAWWNFATPSSVAGDVALDYGYTFPSIGNYTIQLRAQDMDGWPAALPGARLGTSITHVVQVRDCNVNPLADFDAAGGGSNCVDNRALFFADASVDPDGGPITNYTWDFGDGATGYGVDVIHQYRSNARVNVTLTVVDDDAHVHRSSSTWRAWPATADRDCIPALDDLGTYGVHVGDPLTLNLHATDGDGPSLFFQVASSPPGGNLSAPTLHGTRNLALSGTYMLPPFAHAGTYHVRIRALDGVLVNGQPVRDEKTATILVYDQSIDSDGDGIPDAIDNCPNVPNPNQKDSLGDGVGDACRGTPISPDQPSLPKTSLKPFDSDGDGIPDTVDNCPTLYNPDQSDLDGDGVGDVCDADMDGDGVPDKLIPPTAYHDNCPRTPNPDQRDSIGDGVGDACRNTAIMMGVAATLPRSLAPVANVGSLGAGLLGFTVTALAALGALAWHTRTAIGAGATILFSRLVGKDLLRHPARADLLQRIEAQPGIHFQELVRRSGKGSGAVSHHLATLRRAGLVQAAMVNGYRCYSLPSDEAAGRERALLKTELAVRILGCLAAQPGRSMAGLARSIGASPRSVAYHVRRFSAAELVRLERDGKAMRVRLTEAGRKAANALLLA